MSGRSTRLDAVLEVLDLVGRFQSTSTDASGETASLPGRKPLVSQRSSAEKETD